MSGTNPIATFALTNNATQQASLYKSTIDGNTAVAQRVIDQFAPHAAATPNMTVLVDAGCVLNGITLTEVTQQTSGTITAPSGSNKRIDRAVINRFSGTLSIITGTPTTGTPSAPVLASDDVPVAQIGTTTSPLLSTTTAITNSMILDERALNAVGRGTAGENDYGNTLTATSNVINTKLTTEGTIASASTCDLGSIGVNILEITGTTTINGFGTSATTDNPLYFLRFGGALTLTYNSSSMILPGAASITTAAGDTCVAQYMGSGNWKVLSYSPISGQAIDLPVATSGALGAVKPDGTIITVSSGAITVPKATSGAFGVVEVDGTTITASGGVISANYPLPTAFAVGAFCWGQNTSGSSLSAGSTTSGSNIQVSVGQENGTSGVAFAINNDTIGGTWMACATIGYKQTGLWQRRA